MAPKSYMQVHLFMINTRGAPPLALINLAEPTKLKGILISDYSVHEKRDEFQSPHMLAIYTSNWIYMNKKGKEKKKKNLFFFFFSLRKFN